MREEKQDAKEIELKSETKFGKWFENFWYHYKVQTLIALVLLIAVLISVVQCATKDPDPDFVICYAGKQSLQATSSNTIQKDITSTLKSKTSKDTIFDVYSYLINDDLSSSFVQNNITALKNDLDTATAYIFLLDKNLYDTYTTLSDGTHYMVAISDLVSDTSSYTLTSDGYGIYLKSTQLGLESGFSSLPDDTIICFRVSFSISNIFSQSSAQKKYAKNEELFKSLIQS